MLMQSPMFDAPIWLWILIYVITGFILAWLLNFKLKIRNADDLNRYFWSWILFFSWTMIFIISHEESREYRYWLQDCIRMHHCNPVYSEYIRFDRTTPVYEPSVSP